MPLGSTEVQGELELSRGSPIGFISMWWGRSQPGEVEARNEMQGSTLAPAVPDLDICVSVPLCAMGQLHQG